MAAVRGLDCKLYRNTGNYASPVWNEVDIIKDVTIQLEKASADASTRRSRFREMVGTLKDLGLEFAIKHDRDNADWLAFYEAFFNDTTIELLALDASSATSGALGLRFTCEVFSFGQNEELEGVVFNTVNVKPSAAAENAPEFYEVP